MSLISTYKLSKSYNLMKPLFSGLTFTIEDEDRIGLIGPNGAGKSTLLKILSGQITHNDGEISRRQGLRIGYLEQSPQFAQGDTIYTAILAGTHDPEDWESMSAVHKYISKLGLTEFGEDALVENLSGGWKKRVALARELVKNPDILFLDEPTNHMDIEGITWLEDFLSRARFAVLTITHDRLFLQRVSNRIIELDPRHAGGMLSVQGDYVKYIEIRDQLILAQENREIILKNTLRRETQWLRQGAKARTTKQQARIKAQGELEKQVEGLEERNINRTARLSFVQSERNPKKLLEVKNIAKIYEGKTIFSDVSFVLSPGSRVGILGQNGAGKSTLIRTILGNEEPTSGSVFRSDQLKVAYFDQTRDALDPEVTLYKTLCPVGDFVEFNGQSIHIRSYLDRFLFTPLQMNMKVGALSGGEQSRLLVARLMLTPANLLILDEPTNDLDMATLNVLEQCLVDFNGAIILVTHDRYFLDQVATKLLAFPPKESDSHELVWFADFAQWEAWEPSLKSEIKKESPVANEIPSKKKKLSFKEQYELENMEKTIHEAEEKLEKLNLESAKPENASDSALLTTFSNQMTDLQSEINRLYARWSELGEK
jgi:ATP-binding cassette subfamily F protein uup